MKILLLIVNAVAAMDHSNPISGLNMLAACILAGFIGAEIANYFIAD